MILSTDGVGTGARGAEINNAPLMVSIKRGMNHETLFLFLCYFFLRRLLRSFFNCFLLRSHIYPQEIIINLM